jgi:hypothetical protein
MVVDLEMEDFFDSEEDLVDIEDLEPLEEDMPEDLEESSEEVFEESEDLVEDEEDYAPQDTEPEKEVVNTVERYSSTDLAYPCFVLDGSEVFPKHIISGLTKMIESSLTVEDTIKVYVSINGNLSSIGGVSSVQVKAIIDLLGRDKITAYYEEGYILKGDLIYTLSS